MFCASSWHWDRARERWRDEEKESQSQMKRYQRRERAILFLLTDHALVSCFFMCGGGYQLLHLLARWFHLSILTNNTRELCLCPWSISHKTKSDFLLFHLCFLISERRKKSVKFQTRGRWNNHHSLSHNTLRMEPTHRSTTSWYKIIFIFKKHLSGL